MSEVNQFVNNKFSKTTDKLLWEIGLILTNMSTGQTDPCVCANLEKLIAQNDTDQELQIEQNKTLSQIFDTLNRPKKSFAHASPIAFTYVALWSWWININGTGWIDMGLNGLSMTAVGNRTLLAERIKTYLGTEAQVYVQYPATNRLQIFVHNANNKVNTIELKYAPSVSATGTPFNIPIIAQSWI